MTEAVNLNLSVHYRNIPGALFCCGSGRKELAFKIPREQFSREMLDKFPESGNTFRDKACVYILFGENWDRENLEGEEEAYIGQSQSIDSRFKSHASPSRDWGWSEALIFCLNDDEFNQSHMYYVEGQLIQQAQNCRIPLRNRPAETNATIQTFYKRTADDFVERVKLLCGVLGYKLFEPLPTDADVSQPPTDVDQPSLSDFPTFIHRNSSGRYEATGKLTGNGKTFMVIAGSTISRTEANSIPESGKAKRAELQASGIITDFRFERNYVFRSPSAAAYVVSGGAENGNTFWVGLRDFLQRQQQQE